MAERAGSLPLSNDATLMQFDASMPKEEIRALSFLKVGLHTPNFTPVCSSIHEHCPLNGT